VSACDPPQRHHEPLIGTLHAAAAHLSGRKETHWERYIRRAPVRKPVALQSRRQSVRHKLLCAILLVAILPSLLACQPKVVEKEVQKEVTKEVVKEVTKETVKEVTATPFLGGKKIRLSITTQGDFDDPNIDLRYAQGELIRAWALQHPNVEIEWIPIPPGEHETWQRAQFIAGTPPDMIFGWTDRLAPEPMQEKWIISFDDYLKQKNPYSPNETWNEDFSYPEITLYRWSDDQKVYGVVGAKEGTIGVTAFVYNEDLLVEARTPARCPSGIPGPAIPAGWSNGRCASSPSSSWMRTS
jgi:ABC-type glycerol-3-phosphate transport system substrate-binding protein